MKGVRHFESATPHFFKIVLSGALQSGTLGIPKKFVRKYGSNLSDLVFLQLASGDVWEVELLRENDGAFLGRGWPDFAQYYAVEEGHFLMFRYEGGSAFRVVIFDKSASEIEYPPISELPKMEENEGNTLIEVSEDNSDQSPQNQRKKLPSSSVLSPSSKKKKKKTHKRLNKQAVGGGGRNSVCDVSAVLKSGYWRRYQTFRGSKKSEAFERATSFQSPSPFFLVFMQPSFVHHALSAPARFFIKYIPNFRSGGDINLYVSNERFWSVRYNFGMYSRRPQIKINRGWKLFVRDNNLKLGDVCVFEIMRTIDQVSFKVIIFRANQDAVEFVQTEEASQHKLETSSSKSCKSEYCQAKNEDASHNQSAGKSYEVEPALQMYKLLEICREANVEGTGGTVSPRGITSIDTASKFRTNQPSFRIVIRPIHLRRSTPNVPAVFVRRFSERKHMMGTLRVGPRTWPIKLCVYPQRYFNSFKGRVTAGWFNFARDNALQAGDICIFELLNSDLLVLKVSIFRKASTKLH